LAEVAKAHRNVIPKLAEELAVLQSLIQEYDPIELMHRAAYMLLPLFLKYRSENEYSREESYFLPAVEYIQYLISRTPAKADRKKLEESEWEKLWSSAAKVLHLTQQYLFTRRTISAPPKEIEQLRFILDGRRLLIRVQRYPVYFADNLCNSLLPYEQSIEEVYGVDMRTLVEELEKIDTYQKSGVINRYRAFREKNEQVLTELKNCGISIDQAAVLSESERLGEVLNSPALEKLVGELQEQARLTLTPALFDITDLTWLPRPILSLLSIRPGESILTSLTGPNHDDLSPLSTSVLHYKPFVEGDGRFYFFYHSGFEDRIAEIIEADLFARFRDRVSAMRARRDKYLEELATNLLASIVNPDAQYRNVHYPIPDQPGTLTELDALLIADDVLFLVEIKAGGFSAAASRGAPDSLFDDLADTIGTGQRQSERAEKYIKSADEVPFFDETGRRELVRIRHASFRGIFRVVVTREDLGWVGARIAILSMLDPKMSRSFPWHVSLDDLRVVAELFKNDELRFVHFLEQRLKASAETALTQHDEIEHIALYNSINLYHELPVQGMSRVSYDPSYMREIDIYFSERYAGKSPDIPKQRIPPRLAQLLEALKRSRLGGRFEAASIILSTDDIGRAQLEDALKHLDQGKVQGRQRSVRMPFTSEAYGLTVSYAQDRFWEQELLRSAAQMEQGRCNRWVAIQLAAGQPYEVARIDRVVPGRISERELAQARAHIEERVRQTIKTQSIGRNDKCPCGSGLKYKKCHGK
jgi:hypothetical protein